MRRALAICVAIAVLGLAAGASATTMVYLSIDDLYDRSDAVVRGTVVSQTSFWGDEGQMFTDTTLSVDETIAGEAPDPLVFRQMGGQIGDVRAIIPGDARFEQGEHVVLFVRQVEGVWYLTAMGQSKLEVSLQDDLGVPGGHTEMSHPLASPVDATVIRDLSDIAFFAPNAEGGRFYHLEAEILTLEILREMAAPLDAPVEGGER